MLHLFLWRICQCAVQVGVCWCEAVWWMVLLWLCEAMYWMVLLWLCEAMYWMVLLWLCEAMYWMVLLWLFVWGCVRNGTVVIVCVRLCTEWYCCDCLCEAMYGMVLLWLFEVMYWMVVLWLFVWGYVRNGSVTDMCCVYGSVLNATVAYSVCEVLCQMVS